MKWAAAASGSTFVGCILAQGDNNQSITAGSYQPILFPSEIIDTDGFHSTSSNTGRITIPSGKAGKYLITANFTFGNYNTAKYLAIYKNGSIVPQLIAWQANSLTTTPYSMSGMASLAVSDYIELMAYSDIASETSRHSFSVVLLGV